MIPFGFKGFKVRVERRSGLKMVATKPGIRVEVTASGNPKNVKHFRESAERMLLAMALTK